MEESKHTHKYTVIDLLESSDEECQVVKFVQKDYGPVFDLTEDDNENEKEYKEELEPSTEELETSKEELETSEEESKALIQKELTPKEEEDDKDKEFVSPEKGESSGILPSRSFRNFDKCLEKAIAEIKRGGSLTVVSAQYGISQDILYNKIISRRLPREMDVLTKFEENSLVKWILKQNKKNVLVFKQHLLERVGRWKKIFKITPIFSKSKFGKMWYEYFLKSRPEICDNDGLLMPSGLSPIDNNTSPGKSSLENESGQQTFKIEPPKVKMDLAELWLTFGIKEAVVVLHDFRKVKKSPFDHNEKENMPFQPQQDSGNDDNLDKCSIKIEPYTRTQISTDIPNGTGSDFGKDVSSVLNMNVKKVKGKQELNTLRQQCKKCLKTFCNRSKLLRHLVLHTPKELYTITCYKCCRKFPSQYHFKLHTKLSHSTNYHGCDECGNVFKHQTSLTNHKRRVHGSIKKKTSNFTCDMCGKSFKYKNSLENHIIYGHLKEEKKYSCDICRKNFIKNSALIRHRMRHSKIKPFTCSYCQKTFSRKYLLREHVDVCSINKKNNIDCKEFLEISKEYLGGISLD